MLQRTLKNTIKATGITLHGGETAVLTLRPAPANTGIIFVVAILSHLFIFPQEQKVLVIPHYQLA